MGDDEVHVGCLDAIMTCESAFAGGLSLSQWHVNTSTSVVLIFLPSGVGGNGCMRLVGEVGEEDMLARMTKRARTLFSLADQGS